MPRQLHCTSWFCRECSRVAAVLVPSPSFECIAYRLLPCVLCSGDCDPCIDPWPYNWHMACARCICLLALCLRACFCCRTDTDAVPPAAAPLRPALGLMLTAHAVCVRVCMCLCMPCAVVSSSDVIKREATRDGQGGGGHGGTCRRRQISYLFLWSLRRQGTGPRRPALSSSSLYFDI